MLAVIGFIYFGCWLLGFGGLILFLPLVLTFTMMTYHGNHSSVPVWWIFLLMSLGFGGTFYYLFKILDEAPFKEIIWPVIIIVIFGFISDVYFFIEKNRPKDNQKPKKFNLLTMRVDDKIYHNNSVRERDNYEKTEYNNDAYDNAVDTVDEDTLRAKQVCERLRQNLHVDMGFWNENQLNFHCMLVVSGGDLQLNYEIRNVSGISWPDNDGTVWITANVYDYDGNLIGVEDDYINVEDLGRNRYSDYIRIYDDLQEAASMEVYAYYEE